MARRDLIGAARLCGGDELADGGEQERMAPAAQRSSFGLVSHPQPRMLMTARFGPNGHPAQIRPYA